MTEEEEPKSTIAYQPNPQWICSEYVQKVLRKFFNDNDLQIIEISIMPATAKGENYASTMTRVRAKYASPDQRNLQVGSYLIKSMVDNDEFVCEKLSVTAVFPREMEIYSIVIPKLHKILQSKSLDEELAPAIMDVDYERDSIMFEDLKVRSFVSADRVKGLDMVHAKMVLRKLAKWHAASAVLGNVEPEIFLSYDRGMMTRRTDVHVPFYLNSLRFCASALSRIPGYEKYASKMFDLQTELIELGSRAFDSKDNYLNVCAHGDLWTSNVLFKYNENNEPVDAILIDFQNTFWGSATIDLHYFFNTSLSDELVLDGQEELVQYYYEKLAENLRSLEYKGKIPTLKGFWIEFMDTSFYGFVSACLVKPYLINEDAAADADMAALLLENERADNFKKAVYSNERVHRYLKKLLPIFDRKGLLDPHQ
ncbi:unnamed protein product [Hermetia illucens]|uniref:CHK kinase-like domain-containing protein n=1 Tax=Hermetia illucens TaxID=343691 RepID=A0A7R8Z0U1_HERIL|nr:uncharacterized protein LOC119659426 [Hermetia illucens]CAD7091881.1 unnamed protein product [Hermetia illucens]